MGRRRKYCGGDTVNGDFELKHPIKHRNTANARERARMRVLSKAFVKLKTTLPWVPPDTKLSKLDTLRLASSYIAHLRQLLLFEEDHSSLHPISLTWPFVIPIKQECDGSASDKSSSAEESINTRVVDGPPTAIKQEAIVT